MSPTMRVALTGTPGVGKSTVARASPWPLVHLHGWAQSLGAVAGRDDADDADVIDMDALAGPFDELGRPAIIDGHLAHLLPVDAILVLRCNPTVLRERLEARGYSARKVAENVEAEAMDIILQEALDAGPPVIQRDGTRRSPGDIWQSFAEVLSAPLKGHELEPVDWSDELRP